MTGWGPRIRSDRPYKYTLLNTLPPLLPCLDAPLWHLFLILFKNLASKLTPLSHGTRDDGRYSAD